MVHILAVVGAFFVVFPSCVSTHSWDRVQHSIVIQKNVLVPVVETFEQTPPSIDSCVADPFELEPAPADADTDTDVEADTALIKSLAFWLLGAFFVVIVFWMILFMRNHHIAPKAGGKHHHTLDQVFRKILPQLKRNGRRVIGRDDAPLFFYQDYNVHKYYQFSRGDLILILTQGFGKTVKDSPKDKLRLIDLIITAYSAVLANMEMKELVKHVQGKNLPPFEPDMDKDQLIRLAVEAGF